MTTEPHSGKPARPGSGATAHALFPGGTARGRSFINRIEEYKRLINDINAGRHSWFDCPPRYGVTTLVERMRREIQDQDSPRVTSIVCHLNAVHDVTSFCGALMDGAGQLASQTMRRSNVETKTVEKVFKGVEKEIYLDQNMLHSIRFHSGSNPLHILQKVMLKLDQLAGNEDCRCVFILRDTQQLLALRECDELLSAIKQIVGGSENTTWLVQGHNRYSMQQLFQSKNAILFSVFKRFTLRPINASIYAQHLGDAAQRQWQCFIGRKAIAMILKLTDRHPYWLNALCRGLWCSDLPPVIQDVVNAWTELVRQHRHITSREMERLSPNQRAVLLCIAQTPTDQPRSKTFVKRTRVSSASVGQAIKVLAELDLIHSDPDGAWVVSNPIMQWSLYQRTDLVDSIYEELPELFS